MNLNSNSFVSKLDEQFGCCLAQNSSSWNFSTLLALSWFQVGLVLALSYTKYLDISFNST